VKEVIGCLNEKKENKSLKKSLKVKKRFVKRKKKKDE